MIINWTELLIAVSNDTTFMKEILYELFIEIKNFQETFVKVLKERNYQLLYFTSHGLKGTLDYLYCENCRKIVVAINNLTKECKKKGIITDSELNQIKKLYIDFEKQVNILKREVDRFYSKQ